VTPRGGARQGAGRPATGRRYVGTLLYLTPEQRDWLQEASQSVEELGGRVSVSALVRWLVDKQRMLEER
jgi:hypothetical protein